MTKAPNTPALPPKAPRIIEEAISFQTPIDEIAAERPTFFLRSTSYVIMGLFLSMLAIAAWVKVDIVVVGTGRLSTDIPPIVLQPIERAIIREMRVKVGDKVEKGEILAILDSTFTQADVASLRLQHDAFQAQIHRLETEWSNKPYRLPENATSDDELQESLYHQRQAEYKSRMGNFDEEIKRLESAITSLQSTRPSMLAQVDMSRQVEAMRNELYNSKNGSKLNALAARSDRIRSERDLLEADNRLPELTHTLASKQAEKQTFEDGWRRDLLEKLVTVQTDMAKLGEGMAKAARMNELVVVKAPEAGMVLDIARRSVGSVMREAEPLITIVPSNATLIAEITISSADIGYTKLNDSAVIKIDAFPYQKHGMLHGKLVSISPDSYSAAGGPGMGEDQGGSIPAHKGAGGAVHRGRVQLEPGTKLEKMEDGSGLIPGMTLSADIRIGSRSVLGFFLNPILRTFNESLREA